MATFQWSRNLLKAVSTLRICQCGFTGNARIFPLTSQGRKITLAPPHRITNVARYYEKPKDKKGPTPGSWAFLIGASSGLLIGAVVLLGNYAHLHIIMNLAS